MNNQEGQVVIEYVLMLALVASLGFGIFNRIKDYLAEGGNSVILSPFSAFESENPSKRYKNFRIAP